MNAPSRCSIVLVSGSALKELPDIKLTIKHLAHEMMVVPYMMVLLVEDPNISLNTDTFHQIPPDPRYYHQIPPDSNRFPPMVRWQGQVLQCYYTDTDSDLLMLILILIH